MVEWLPVHLPEVHVVYFQTGYKAGANFDMDSKLRAIFKLWKKNISAHTYLRHKIPVYFVWSKGQWNSRKKITECFERIYTVNIADTERYYLRELFLHVQGLQLFHDLRTNSDGVLCNLFQEASEKIHLVINDAECK